MDTLLALICLAIVPAVLWRKRKKNKTLALIKHLESNATDNKLAYLVRQLTGKKFELFIQTPPTSRYEDLAERIATKCGEESVQWLMQNGFKSVFKAAKSDGTAFQVVVAYLAKGLTGKDVLNIHGMLVYNDEQDRLEWVKSTDECDDDDED